MFINFKKTERTFTYSRWEEAVYCLIFFIAANSYIRMLFKKSFYKEKIIYIKNKEHIEKTNIFGETYYFYKNKIHREDYKHSVISRNLSYWKFHTYIHGKKISESERLTKKELNKIQNQINKEKIQSKVLNF